MSNGIDGLANYNIAGSDTFYFNGTGSEVFDYTVNLAAIASIGDTDLNETGGAHEDSYGYLYFLQNPVFSADASGFLENSGSILCEVQLDAQTGGGSTCTGQLDVQGGSSLGLGLELVVRTAATGGGAGNVGPLSADFNASNAYFTLTPVTEGAAFTTASGLTYTAAPDAAASTPEPSTFLLFGVSLIAAGLVRPRRSRKR
jgi:hypothetical protein